MTELGPLLINAHNQAQAEYLVRTRAEQRGLHVSEVDVTGGQPGQWLVRITVSDDVALAEAARLGDDTLSLHLEGHPSRRMPPPNG